MTVQHSLRAPPAGFCVCAGLRLALGGAAAAAGGPADPHAQHMHPMPPKAAFVCSTVSYKLPNVTVVRVDGSKVSFQKEIDDGKPVILNFIYTTCAAICPVMTQIFAEVQNRLGSDRDKLRTVSVSIDPEQDTPVRLRDYARRYSAGLQWQFYTGTVEASIAVQKAFDAYRADKMNHLPVTIVRLASGKPWVRLDGFATPDHIVKEYRTLVAEK